MRTLPLVVAALFGLAGCKSHIASTVGGGVCMGVGGITALSSGVGLATSQSGSNAAGIDNPAAAPLIAFTLIGAVAFFIGVGLLVNGANLRKKAVAKRKHGPLPSERRRSRSRATRTVEPRSKGVSIARSFYARLRDLDVDEIEKAYATLDAVEQALFLAEWRAQLKRRPSEKARLVLEALKPSEQTPEPETTTATTADPPPPPPPPPRPVFTPDQ